MGINPAVPFILENVRIIPHCIVLLFFNVKTSLSFLIHTFPAAQTGDMEVQQYLK